MSFRMSGTGCFAGAQAIRVVFAGLVLTVAVGTLPAGAQSERDLNRTIEQQQQIQRSQQERLRQELERSRTSPRPPSNLETPTPPPVIAPPTGPCLHVTSVEIEGAEHLGDADRASLTAPSQGKCLNKAAIQTLMADVTANYIARGYTTTRVYLPAQDLQSGMLKIRVVEGRVEKIVIEDPGFGRMGAWTAFPGVVGAPFYLRDFEQGLDQLNKLPYNNATIDIQPGTEAGDSVVVIRNKPTKLLPVGLYLSRDNQGLTSTGRLQDSASLDVDGLLGLNELLALTYLYTHGYGDSDDDSHALSGALSVPLGYTTVTGSLSRSEYATLVQGTSLSFPVTGTSLNHGIVVDHLLYRDRDSKVGASTGITRKSVKSYIAENLVEVSSHVLTVWDADIRAQTSFLGGQIYADFGYSQGLHLLGAKADYDLTATEPQAQFKKIRYSGGWQRPFEALGEKFSFSTQLTGQHGIDVLYSSEQISVGGTSSVRGFLDTSVAGDRGWHVRNDLVLRKSWDIWEVPVGIYPKVGFDYGRIYERNDIPGGTLSGISFGVSSTVGPLSLDLQQVFPVIRSDLLSHEPSFTFFKLSLGL